MTKFVNFNKHTNVKNIFLFEFVCDLIFFIVPLLYFCQQRARGKNLINKQNDNENSSKIIEIKNISKFFESVNKIRLFVGTGPILKFPSRGRDGTGLLFIVPRF